MLQPIHSKDYIAEAGNSEEKIKVANGSYKIKEVEFNSSCLGEDGKPFLADGKFGLVCYLNLTTVDDIVIPMSVTLANMPYVVQSFTDNTEDLLPPVPNITDVGLHSEYLLNAVYHCNTSTRNPLVKVVKDSGWGQWYNLSNNKIPKDKWGLKLVRFIPIKGETIPRPTENNYEGKVNYQYSAEFEIVLNSEKKSCGWTGARFTQQYLPYRIIGTNTDEGQSFNWESYKSGEFAGEPTPTASIHSALIDATAPNLIQDFELPYIADVKNILPEWARQAKTDNQVFFATLTITQSKTGAIYNKLLPETIIERKVKLGDKLKEVSPKDVETPSHLIELRIVFNSIHKNNLLTLTGKLPTNEIIDTPLWAIVDNPTFNVELTDDQKGFYVKYISPHKDNLEAKTPDLLNKLTSNDVLYLLGEYAGDKDITSEATKKLIVDTHTNIQSLTLDIQEVF